jgi:hypothetical protein
MFPPPSDCFFDNVGKYESSIQHLEKVGKDPSNGLLTQDISLCKSGSPIT